MIRDTLGHVPSILLRHEIYVTASVLGACAYVGLDGLGLGRLPAMIVPRDLHRTGPGDQVRVVVAGLPRVGDARALDERTQGLGGMTGGYYLVDGGCTAV